MQPQHRPPHLGTVTWCGVAGGARRSPRDTRGRCWWAPARWAQCGAQTRQRSRESALAGCRAGCGSRRGAGGHGMARGEEGGGRHAAPGTGLGRAAGPPTRRAGGKREQVQLETGRDLSNGCTRRASSKGTGAGRPDSGLAGPCEQPAERPPRPEPHVLRGRGSAGARSRMRGPRAGRSAAPCGSSAPCLRGREGGTACTGQRRPWGQTQGGGVGRAGRRAWGSGRFDRRQRGQEEVEPRVWPDRAA